MLGTENLHSVLQTQIPQNSNGWSATANPQVCGTFAVIFCTSARANDFYFDKLKPETLLLFFPGLVSREISV